MRRLNTFALLCAYYVVILPLSAVVGCIENFNAALRKWNQR